MAALGRIRKHGVLLVACFAIALFLFVAGDLFRGGEGWLQESKQKVGEINGKSISIQEYQSLIDEFQSYYEIVNGTNPSGEEQLNQIKDEAWQTYVQSQLIEKECEELGLTVTDQEIREIIQSGASDMLRVPLFMNQQTGQYDYALVQGFLNEYKKLQESGSQIPDAYTKTYKYYMFAQKQIRSQALVRKYQTLLAKSLVSNSIEAKRHFEERTNESDVILASIPFTSIDDSKVKVSDDEIKDYYNKNKEQYYQLLESRDIKYIDVVVTADENDKLEAEKNMEEAYKLLLNAKNNTAAGNVCRQQTSASQFTDILKRKDAYPMMLASLLDSVAVGETVKPQYDPLSGTYYTFRLLDRQTEADSVLYRQIIVPVQDAEASQKTADSILNAIKAGSKFAEVAKKFNQPSDSIWLSTVQYQTMESNPDNELFIKTLFSMGDGESKVLKMTNGMNVILQVLQKKNPVTKYNVASIIKPLNFSEKTYTNVYNKFSSFLAKNNTLEKIEANAEKSGYLLQTSPDIIANQHTIGGIPNTREAIKWVFDNAKENQVSELFRCGNSDHFVVVALTGVNKKGYRTVEKAKDIIKHQVMDEKKAETIIADLKGVKSIDAAVAKGALIDSLNHISFQAPAFVRSTNTSEPLVSALASKTKKDQFAGPIKGTSGVYMLYVTNKTKTEDKLDLKQEKAIVSQSRLGAAFQTLINTLYMKADVVDNRYKFF